MYEYSSFTSIVLSRVRNILLSDPIDLLLALVPTSPTSSLEQQATGTTPTRQRSDKQERKTLKYRVRDTRKHTRKDQVQVSRGG